MGSSGTDLYVYGSTARKIQYDVYKENPILRNKRKVGKYNHIKAKLFLSTLLAFVCGMLIMYRYAVITELNYKIQDARSRFERLENNNLVTRVYIQSQLDLSIVRDMAESRLSMHEPRSEQIIMVHVPRRDYIKRNPSYMKEPIRARASYMDGIGVLGRMFGLIH
jgi:hypothetical protein